MNVANRKCIIRLSIKNMATAKSRNIVAVIAIALTTLLFTSLFTIMMSIVSSFEQSNFRQVGGYSHGSFKYLTEEQFNELKDDPLIKEYGMRRFVGVADEVPFNKLQVEIGYSDANDTKWMFIDPVKGCMPKENTNEAATDTRVLSLLGIEPEIGKEFTMSFKVDGVETTEVFTLSGWWEYDEAIPANHVIIPQSRVDEIFGKLGTLGKDGMTGSYNMDVMLSSSAHNGSDIITILERHGYQNDDPSADNYIAKGVNWGYFGAQVTDSLDGQTVLTVIGLLLLIILTGYLIIYNVFRISVANDIRHYGLLKTIGTTGRQIKRIIYIQALSLSVIGIPLGLLLGYSVGAVLTPVVMTRLDGLNSTALSGSPLIFIGAAIFSLITVIISCRKPGRIAAGVSPIEALRYTEGSSGVIKRSGKGKKSVSITKMAVTNIGRSKGKTAVTIISMSLAAVLLTITVTFTNGFDMNKYLTKMTSDYIIADSAYFRVNSLWGGDNAITEDIISEISSQDGVSDGGRTYGLCSYAEEFVSEEHFRNKLKHFGNTDEAIDRLIDDFKNLDENGLIEDDVQLYGAEKFCMDKMTVLDGDISKLYEDSNYIAAVYSTDDYGNIKSDTNWAKVGDKVKIRLVEEFEYINTQTGEIITDFSQLENVSYRMRADKYRDIEFEVAALVDVPTSLSYRYYGSDEFILNAETFKRYTDTDKIMYYAYDTEDSSEDAMDSFLADYTENVMPQLSYESKSTYAAEFESFKEMFTILGTSLSFIVALVGILNFINAVLTGIITRRREFAVLRAIGMTGRQLKQMLITEGFIYAAGAVIAAVVLVTASAVPISMIISEMFWFFSYKFTLMPITIITPIFAVMGVLVPLIAYKFSASRSIVEQLRQDE